MTALPASSLDVEKERTKRHQHWGKVALALVAALAGLAGGGAAGTAFAPKPLSQAELTNVITDAVESVLKPLYNRVAELERRSEMDRIKAVSFEAEWRAQISAFQATLTDTGKKVGQVAETTSHIAGVLDEMRRRSQ